jgi:hypothetical protein
LLKGRDASARRHLHGPYLNGFTRAVDGYYAAEFSTLNDIEDFPPREIGAAPL